MNDLLEIIKSQLIKTDLSKLLFYAKVEDALYRPVSKKNNRPIRRVGKVGRVFLGKSKDLETQEALLLRHFTNFKIKQNIKEPIEGELHVLYHFHFGPEHSRSYHLCDLSNLFEIVSDQLQNSGIIDNDRFIHSFDGSRKFLGDKTYLEVFIMRFGDE